MQFWGSRSSTGSTLLSGTSAATWRWRCGQPATTLRLPDSIRRYRGSKGMPNNRLHVTFNRWRGFGQVNLGFGKRRGRGMSTAGLKNLVPPPT